MLKPEVVLVPETKVSVLDEREDVVEVEETSEDELELVELRRLSSSWYTVYTGAPSSNGIAPPQGAEGNELHGFVQ